MKRSLGFLLAPVLSLLIAGPALACTPQSSGNGKRIEEAGFVELGGLEQWVTIRGADRANPVLLHVHGGPGFAFSAFTEEFSLYEADFTVVQWDERGAGCTFGRHGAETPDVTLERLALDGIELAGHLKHRLGKDKIIVLAHSAGSIIGTDMVKRAPEHFAAYVGVGQFASFAGTVQAQYAYLRRVAETANDAELRARLDAIGSVDLPTVQHFLAINALLNARVPPVDAAALERLQSRMPALMKLEELASWRAGQQASVRWLLPGIAAMSLVATTPRLAVPFILIQGADDVFTPTPLAIAYYTGVEAPAKELVVVQSAGHFPQLTHAQSVLAALVRAARAHALQ
jgi:pimeloyl-ACP methyl ester carboxylesterase